MAITKMKVWSEYFEAILDGRKTFELRRQNHKIEEGDTVLLREWDPYVKDFTGRKKEKVIKEKGQVTIGF